MIDGSYRILCALYVASIRSFHAYEPSVGCYRDVFGWDAHTMSDMDEFRYTTLGEGEGALAGIMDATVYRDAGAPSAWEVFKLVQS